MRLFGLSTLILVNVSIHASVKDATYPLLLLLSHYKVSIHASVKDATKARIMKARKRGFNPRICKRCDLTTTSLIVAVIVSIHASVKDATMTQQ